MQINPKKHSFFKTKSAALWWDMYQPLPSKILIYLLIVYEKLDQLADVTSPSDGRLQDLVGVTPELDEHYRNMCFGGAKAVRILPAPKSPARGLSGMDVEIAGYGKGAFPTWLSYYA